MHLVPMLHQITLKIYIKADIMDSCRVCSGKKRTFTKLHIRTITKSKDELSKKLISNENKKKQYNSNIFILKETIYL